MPLGSTLLVNRLVVNTSPGVHIYLALEPISTRTKRGGARMHPAVGAALNQSRKAERNYNMTIYEIQIILTIHNNDNLSRKAEGLLL